MAEAIATLSLVCNVMAVITFAHDVVVLWRNASKDGSPDPRLTSNTAQLAELASSLQESAKEFNPTQLVHSGTLNDSETRRLDAETRLKTLASDLARDTKELQALLGKVAATSFLRRLIAVIMYRLYYQRRISSLESRIDASRNIMNVEFLSRLCSSTRAADARSQLGFATLHANIKLFIDRWAEGKRTISELISGEAETTRAHVTLDGELTRNRIDDIGTRMEQESTRRMEEEARQKMREANDKLLSTLWFPEMNARENGIEEATDLTVDWVFSDGTTFTYLHESIPFKGWLESEQPVFWISGKPASGKSTLIKSIVRNSQTAVHLQTWRSSARICRFYFYEIGTSPLQKQLKGCFRTLLHQILSDLNISGLLIRAHPELATKRVEHDWTLKELEETLHKALNVHGSAFCIFLDGLDEIESHQRTDVARLVTSLGSLPNVKICASCRPEAVFRRHFDGCPVLRVQDFNVPAIRFYTTIRLEEYNIFRNVDQDVFQGLVEKLVAKSEGIFLWAVLAVRSLTRGVENGDTLETMLQRIDELSPGLYDLFKQMWKRNNEDLPLYKKEASEVFWFALLLDKNEWVYRNVLIYLLGTHDSLREELQRIVATQGGFPPKGDHQRISRAYVEWLAARSAGLIEITRGYALRGGFMALLGFIHRSVGEFLRSTTDGQDILSYDQRPMAEKWLAVAKATITSSSLIPIVHNPDFICMASTMEWFGTMTGALSIALGLTDEEQCQLISPWNEGRVEKFHEWWPFEVAASCGIMAFFPGHRADKFRSLSPSLKFKVLGICNKILANKYLQFHLGHTQLVEALYQYGFTNRDIAKLEAKLWQRYLYTFHWLLREEGGSYTDDSHTEGPYKFERGFTYSIPGDGSQYPRFLMACIMGGIKEAMVIREIADVMLDCLQIFEERNGGHIWIGAAYGPKIAFQLDASWFSHAFSWIATGKSLENMPVCHDGNRGSAYIEVSGISRRENEWYRPNRGSASVLKKLKVLKSNLEGFLWASLGLDGNQSVFETNIQHLLDVEEELYDPSRVYRYEM